MSKVLELKERMTSIKPLHDTLFGRIHPYWARKPLNIVREIVRTISDEGDIVCDPFMGCGTTVFGCLLEKRSIIATDINPLASLIVLGTLSLCRKPEQKMKALTEFVEDIQYEVMKWFSHCSTGNIIERERYTVEGEFDNGNYELIPDEFVLRLRVGNRFKKRAITNEPDFGLDNMKVLEEVKLLQNSPIDFENCQLVANSRIAIPRGALLSHYFTERNIACINYALRLINECQYDEDTKTLLKFFISSALPLLRLSDYKASSQWPYWRPKKRLTSRNPVFVFRRRLGEFRKAQRWLLDHVPAFEKIEHLNLTKQEQTIQVFVNRMSVQELGECFSRNTKVDLVLTDPPYGDHVPYLEYSSMWNYALGLTITTNDLENEIVKTDATGRGAHTSQYLDKLLLGLEICAEILKDKGHLIWFYQDSSLKNWAALYGKGKELGLQFVSAIPVPKQRRSMKTLTTPGKTFDGDLILVFQKVGGNIRNLSNKGKSADIEMKKALDRIQMSDSNFFFRYADLVQNSFENGWITELAGRYNDIREVIR